MAVEGWKQLDELSSRLEIAVLFYCGRPESRLQRLMRRSRQTVRLSERLLKLLSDVETPQGVLAFVDKPAWRWEDLTPFLLYLEGVQDPGNLGTLLRSARAAGGSIVTGPGSVSFFNRKVVRATSAALFSTPFRQGATVDELARRGYLLWAAQAGCGEPLFEMRFELPLAVMLGSEGTGLSRQALQAAQGKLQIPMQPGSESLNLSVAGSLILYEAYRQLGVVS